jgi:NTP pyrophosphatase (non-canonical NTP hydrolase)
MRLITDRRLLDFVIDNPSEIGQYIAVENINQLLKWGTQSHTPAVWMLFVTEEVGELAQAISEAEFRNGAKSDVVKEAIQAATLILKIAEMYMPDKQNE